MFSVKDSGKELPKLRMETVHGVSQNVEKLKDLFPHWVTETKDEKGRYKLELKMDVLLQDLQEDLIQDPTERYQLTWPGKRKALLTANESIQKTLRPCRGESVNFDTTGNLFIEGDNLDALKLLQESYLGKVKMIYIDPPYNTGNDFIYKDDFSQSREEYDLLTGHVDEEGERLVANKESNGRFHSDWLSFIYPRLKIARNFLADDGVIFISIDDNEVANLRKLCDEIFGADNFVSNVIWQKKYSPQNDAKWLSDNHDHILIYAKNKEIWRPLLLPRTEEQNDRYNNPDNDVKGPWKLVTLHAKSGNNSGFKYTFKNGYVWEPPSGTYPRYSLETFKRFEEENRIWFGKAGQGSPSVKKYLSEVKDGITPLTIWTYDVVGHNHEAKEDIKSVFGGLNGFETPKPIRLLKRLIHIGGSVLKNDIILDFFAGSSTTAHAVMQLNAEDGGNRKFIMVQIPEVCDPKSEAAKAGYATIAEISKERIRRAGQKILEAKDPSLRSGNSSLSEAKGLDLDIGFRVLKVDSTNMKPSFYKLPHEITQADLFDYNNPFKDDRTAEDLLFQCLLEWHLTPDMPISTFTLHGKTIYSVDNNSLLACFDEGLTKELVTDLAGLKPAGMIFTDRGFKDDSVKINVKQIFEYHSSHTDIKTL